MEQSVATLEPEADREAVPAAPAPAGPLRIEQRSRLDVAAGDEAVLQDLIDGRPAVGAFVSTPWLSGYFAEPPGGGDPSVLLMKDGGRLQGVVPIAVRRTRIGARVTLLGGGAGSDRVDVLAARGREAACADALLGWLEDAFGQRGFVLELRDVPGDSPLWGAIHRAGAEGQPPLTLVPLEVHPHPYLDLTEAPRDGGVPPNHAASIDKHRRWLSRRGRLAVDVLHDADEALDAFETLTRFLHARWHRGRDGSALDDQRAQRFHRHAIPLLLQQRRLRMIRFSSGGRIIAVFYGLACRGWWGYYLAGYDREWAGRIHLGRVLLSAAIELAAQHGAAEFDFLKGAEPVKYFWRVRERATVDADVYSAGVGPQLSRATRAGRDALAALARSAARLFPVRRRR